MAELVEDDQAPAPSTLDAWLESGAPVEPGREYAVRTAFGRELKVTLSRDLAKTYQTGERETMRRLLGAIATGASHQSGIKSLSGNCPGLVEIKHIMHGHKRIFGCLEGDVLELKKLIEIKDDRNAYF